MVLFEVKVVIISGTFERNQSRSDVSRRYELIIYVEIMHYKGVPEKTKELGLQS